MHAEILAVTWFVVGTLLIILANIFILSDEKFLASRKIIFLRSQLFWNAILIFVHLFVTRNIAKGDTRVLGETYRIVNNDKKEEEEEENDKNNKKTSGGGGGANNRDEKKTVLVTGAAGGIGLFTSLHFALRGHQVVLGCRSLKRCKEAEATIRSLAQEKFGRIVAKNLQLVSDVAPLELESFDSVRFFVKKYEEMNLPLDILINNAGIIPSSSSSSSSSSKSKTSFFSKYESDLELATVVNFLSPFLLTELLIPIMKRTSSNPRIVIVSSTEHNNAKFPSFSSSSSSFSSSSSSNLDSKIVVEQLEGLSEVGNSNNENNNINKNKSSMGRYRLSKLAQLHHAAHILLNHKIPCCSLHPGFVVSDITSGLLPDFVVNVLLPNVAPFILTKRTEEGAATTLHCALKVRDEELIGFGKKNRTAPYYADCCETTASEIARSPEAARETCKWAMKQLGLKWEFLER